MQPHSQEWVLSAVLPRTSYHRPPSPFEHAHLTCLLIRPRPRTPFVLWDTFLSSYSLRQASSDLLHNLPVASQCPKHRFSSCQATRHAHSDREVQRTSKFHPRSGEWRSSSRQASHSKIHLSNDPSNEEETSTVNTAIPKHIQYTR
jgi:hypothetical protein